MAGELQTVAELFEQSIALEKAAETLYRQFEQSFAAYPDVSLFWKRYADEEKGHASYLERVRDGVEAERLVRAADKDIMRKVRKCLDAVLQVKLESIRNLEDAYQLATELENSETNTIFEFIITNFSPDELIDSRKFLRAQLNTHIARLGDEFPPEYQMGTARQNVSVAKRE